MCNEVILYVIRSYFICVNKLRNHIQMPNNTDIKKPH